MDNTTRGPEIDLKDLLFSVLHRWRLIILTAILFGALLGGYRMGKNLLQRKNADYLVQVQEQYQQDCEEYEHLNVRYQQEIENIEKNIEVQKEYINNSVLMKIDPYEKGTASADIFVKPDEMGSDDNAIFLSSDYTDSIIKAYMTYAQSLGIKEIAKDMGIEEKYLRELVAFSPDYASNTLSISVCHTNIRNAERVLNSILDGISAQSSDLESKLGKHDIYIMNRVSESVSDSNLATTQKNNNANIDTLQNTLKDTEKTLKGLNEPGTPMALSNTALLKSGIKYTVFGGALGVFFAVFCICFLSLMTDKIASAKELDMCFNIRILGVFEKKQKKRIFSAIDNWLDHLEGIIPISDEDVLNYASVNIQNMVGTKQSLMIAGTVEKEKLQKVHDNLQEKLPALTFELALDISSNADSLRKLSTCDYVILVEERGTSKRNMIQHELSAIANAKKAVIGCLVY